LSAPGAAPELIVINLGQGLELTQDFLLGCGFQARVATQTSAEWRQDRAEIKSPENFDRLFERILRAEIVAMFHRAVHQQSPISGQQGAALAHGGLDELSIFGVAVISHVYSKQTQIANQLSKVTVGNKLSNIAHLQPIFRERSNSSELEWEDIDRCFRADNVAKIHRPAFNQDEINLSVRDAAGF
jgi:hypothetical protein